jgi:RNA polymerase sigma factor (sigma-70 family)
VRKLPKTEKISYLNPEAFQKLLSLLNSVTDNGETAYLNIYQKLINFFSFRGLNEPEIYADKVIDTVLRKISETDITFDEKYYTFFATIAHNHLRDFWKLKKRETSLEDLKDKDKKDVDEIKLRQERDEKEQKFRCLNGCLVLLPPSDKDLIEKYYDSDKRERDELSKSLGISLKTLRVRILRLKEKLRECMTDCLKNF